MNLRIQLQPMLVFLLLFGPYAGAQEPTTAPTTATPAPAGTATTGGKKAEPVPEPDAATPAKPAAAKGSPQRFEPSERVRPDFDVAFPVDI